MVSDYSGFPEHTYRIRYDAPGDPALAKTVHAMLSRGDMPTGLDPGSAGMVSTQPLEAAPPRIVRQISAIAVAVIREEGVTGIGIDVDA